MIVSTCSDDWGGSEELWGRSIPILQERGFRISVVKETINKNHPAFLKLLEINVELIEIYPKRSIQFKLRNSIQKVIGKIALVFKIIEQKYEDFSSFIKILKSNSPSLVIFAQGINFDGLKLANQCLKLGIPYVVIAQKAVDFYWPYKTDRDMMLETLLKSEMIFFVSKHNLRLTEEQFGVRFSKAQIVFNPVKLSGNVVPYPKSTDVYKLACLGRLFIIDKGQDILVRIMAEQKWKNRPVVVSFIGEGFDEKAIKEMVDLLEVKNIEFKGHINDVEAMWEEYHALILPSRSEGLPLSMVEAMSAGRPVIVSNAGGNAELVEDGFTGFIGYPNEESFGAAMERAWVNRDNWKQIGENASKFIAAKVPESPELDFVNLLMKVTAI